jgi:hypothetical protein
MPKSSRQLGSFEGGFVMQTKSGILVLAGCLLVGLTASPSSSRAEIVQKIVDNTDTTIGAIGFPSLTGSSAAGVQFSLEGFTEADIVSISWTLDPSTDGVTTLDLDALTGDNPCPNDHMDCSNSTLSLSLSGFSEGGNSCSFGPDTGICERFESELIPVSFQPVPEPSTWVMAIVGFAGLGYAGSRRARYRRLTGAFG